MSHNSLHNRDGGGDCTGESPVNDSGKNAKKLSVDTIGGRTKISLGEAIAFAAVLLSGALWLHHRFDRIEGKLEQGWTIQNQSEWQREFERTGAMPDPFSVKRRSFNSVGRDALTGSGFFYAP